MKNMDLCSDFEQICLYMYKYKIKVFVDKTLLFKKLVEPIFKNFVKQDNTVWKPEMQSCYHVHTSI